jgi:conjugative transfer region protein TrbK
VGWTAKIAAVAVLAALALTLAVVSAVSPSAPGASALPISGADAPMSQNDVPERCRIAVEPDPECAAAWEAKRRHFFDQQDEAK